MVQHACMGVREDLDCLLHPSPLVAVRLPWVLDHGLPLSTLTPGSREQASEGRAMFCLQISILYFSKGPMTQRHIPSESPTSQISQSLL